MSVQRVKGCRLPNVHLAAISICALIIGLTLSLLPTEPLSATRGSGPDAKRLEQEVSLLDQQLDRLDDTANPTHTSKPPDTAITVPADLSRFSQTGNLPPDPTGSAPAAAVENWVDYIVREGDNLSTVFHRAGLAPSDVYRISLALHGDGVPKRLHPGEVLSFLIEGGELQKLKQVVGPLKTVFVVREGDGYRTRVVVRHPDIKRRFAQGRIDDSLFVDGRKAGLPSGIIVKLASIFGWDVDFALGIRKGDRFRVLYEQPRLDGKAIGHGDILAAEFVNQGHVHIAIRYTDARGHTRYYTPQGESLRKAYLRTPVDFAYISSGFSLNRKHPLLNRIRAHKGVDYAARIGTPIKASGDGKIVFRGVKGGYGNVIILQHGHGISTLYAHMSRFEKGLDIGSRIHQGQVIGYVGMTGLATGPHLHYEFRVNGVQKNPLTVKLPNADPIPPAERRNFQALAQGLTAKLESHAATQIARAE